MGLLNQRSLLHAQKSKQKIQTLATSHLALGKLKGPMSTKAMWLRFQGVPKKFWLYQYCGKYNHFSEGLSYFDLMTQPYRKFADVLKKNWLSFPKKLFMIWQRLGQSLHIFIFANQQCYLIWDQYCFNHLIKFYFCFVHYSIIKVKTINYWTEQILSSSSSTILNWNTIFF